MSRVLLPRNTDLSKAKVRVFLDDAPRADEIFVMPLSDLGGSVDASNLTADDTYNGKVITGFSAGATIAQWEAVYMGSGGTWLLADANGSGTYPARGLATTAGSVALGELVVLTEGEVRNDAWAWTIGGNIYLSTTAGGLTQTAPSTSGERVQAVGFAISADKAIFNFTANFATVV